MDEGLQGLGLIPRTTRNFERIVVSVLSLPGQLAAEVLTLCLTEMMFLCQELWQGKCELQCNQTNLFRSKEWPDSRN